MKRLIRAAALFAAAAMLFSFYPGAFASDEITFDDAPLHYILQTEFHDPVKDAEKEAKEKKKTDETTAEEKNARPVGDFHISFSLSESSYQFLLSHEGTLTAQIDFAVDDGSWLSEVGDKVTPFTVLTEERDMFFSLWFGDIQANSFRTFFDKKIFTEKEVTVDKNKIKVYSLSPEVTMKTRVRLILDDNGTEYSSLWSETFAFGHDADAIPGIAYLDYPVLSDAKLDLDTHSVSFLYEVSENIRACAARMRHLELSGGVTFLLEYSVNGGDWTSITLPDDFSPYVSGEKNIVFPDGVLQSFSYLRLRASCLADGGKPKSGEEPFLYRSEYSASATASASVEIDTVATTAEEAVSTSQESEASEKALEKCPICGNCSQPLGICIFLWLIGLLIILIFVMIVLLIHFLSEKKSCPRCGKGCGKKTAVCSECGYKFTASLPLIEEESPKKSHKHTSARREMFSENENETDDVSGKNASLDPEAFCDNEGRVPYYLTDDAVPYEPITNAETDTDPSDNTENAEKNTDNTENLFQDNTEN